MTRAGAPAPAPPRSRPVRHGLGAGPQREARAILPAHCQACRSDACSSCSGCVATQLPPGPGRQDPARRLMGGAGRPRRRLCAAAAACALHRNRMGGLFDGRPRPPAGQQVPVVRSEGRLPSSALRISHPCTHPPSTMSSQRPCCRLGGLCANNTADGRGWRPDAGTLEQCGQCAAHFCPPGMEGRGVQDCLADHHVKRYWGKDGVLKTACQLLQGNRRALLSNRARGGSQVGFVGAPRMAVNLRAPGQPCPALHTLQGAGSSKRRKTTDSETSVASSPRRSVRRRLGSVPLCRGGLPGCTFWVHFLGADQPQPRRRRSPSASVSAHDQAHPRPCAHLC